MNPGTLLKELHTWFQSAPSGTIVADIPSESQMLALEPRILFDAAALITGLDFFQPDNNPEFVDNTLPPSTDENLVKTISPEVFPTSYPAILANQVLVVDPTVQGWQSLIEGVDSTLAVMVLDPQQDGVEQIGALLAKHTDLTALHLLSHGSKGEIHLGETILSAQTLDNYAKTLQTWGTSFASGADILIYGCDVGAGEDGDALLQGLAVLTGMDVAASDDPTGALHRGADWDLERKSAAIEANNPLLEARLSAFEGILAAPVPPVALPLPGLQDQGVHFDGTDDWVDIPKVAIDVPAGTVSLWFKVDDVAVDVSGIPHGIFSSAPNIPVVIVPIEVFLSGGTGDWRLGAIINNTFQDLSTSFGVIKKMRRIFF